MHEVYSGSRNGWVLFGVAALHVLAVLVLLSLKPVADAVGLSQPLMVSLLAPAEPEPESRPAPLPPRPPVPAAPLAPPPPLHLAAETPAPASLPLPAPEAEPDATPQALPPPAPAKAALSAPSPAISQAPPSPVIPPRFDAAYLENPAPRYPPLSRRRQEEGRVLLRVHVTSEGTASQVEIRETSGFERLDQAAREAVQRWHFVPARQGDQAVAGWVLVPISFSIRS